MCSKGLSSHIVSLSVDTKILKQLKYMVIHSEKGTITTFELFFEGHSANSGMYVRSLGAANPVISHFLL